MNCMKRADKLDYDIKISKRKEVVYRQISEQSVDSSRFVEVTYTRSITS